MNQSLESPKGSARGLFFKRFILLPLRLAVLLYFSACAYLYFFQQQMIFPGAQSNPDNLQQISDSQGIADISFTVDGIQLNGWQVGAETEKPLLIYYGGNAEDISYRALQFSSLVSMHSVFINYRGYGDSGGSPTEKNLYEDALLIYDFLLKKYQPQKIFIVGRSLGSGVATHVAARRKTDALVLITPYNSIAEIAKHRYPLMPIDLMLKHRFDSYLNADKLTMPTLVLLSEVDAVVPHIYSKQLIDQLPALESMITLEGVDHGDIVTNHGFIKIMNNYLMP